MAFLYGGDPNHPDPLGLFNMKKNISYTICKSSFTPPVTGYDSPHRFVAIYFQSLTAFFTVPVQDSYCCSWRRRTGLVCGVITMLSPRRCNLTSRDHWLPCQPCRPGVYLLVLPGRCHSPRLFRVNSCPLLCRLCVPGTRYMIILNRPGSLPLRARCHSPCLFRVNFFV